MGWCQQVFSEQGDAGSVSSRESQPKLSCFGSSKEKRCSSLSPQQAQAPQHRRCEAVEQAFPAFGRVTSPSWGVGRPVLGWVGGQSLAAGWCGGPGPRWHPHLPYSCAPLVTQQRCPSFVCCSCRDQREGNGGSWSQTFPWHVVVGAPLL